MLACKMLERSVAHRKRSAKTLQEGRLMGLTQSTHLITILVTQCIHLGAGYKNCVTVTLKDTAGEQAMRIAAPSIKNVMVILHQ